MSDRGARERKDWVGSARSWTVAWGLPSAALIVGIALDPSARTVIWVVSLAWMGIACVANAARCGRTHCYFTGPFFLVMALVVALHGAEVLWLGPNGWIWIGVTIVIGAYGVLWLLPEYIWGKFARFRRPQ